ncbi:MAG: ATP-binding protein [Oligoflexales bacterium]
MKHHSPHSPANQIRQPESKLSNPIAAEHLKQNVDKIKRAWESKVREQVPKSREQTSFVLVNTLQDFLDELADAIQLGRVTENHFSSASGMSKAHGGQRAGFEGYFLPQLLKEFSILRKVVNDEFQGQGVLTFETRSVIDEAIDSVISIAATEFSKVQHAHTQAALEQAEISNRDLEHFAGVAAHDLKSPIATISGYLSLLGEESKEALGEESLNYIDLMQRAAERMRSLIDSLLNYARLAKMECAFRRTNLNNVAEAAIQNLEDAIQNTRAKITVSPLPSVIGDADLLTQVFQNLIGNSIKFRRSEVPEIHIAAKAQGDMWEVSVRDNGIGFDAKFKEEIFALYKKLHGEGQYQGTGIGLATCRKVIELHGGKIWTESEPNVGSTFYFTLQKIDEQVSHLH